MELHFRGMQVPSLGSPRDLMYRGYMLHQARLEAKKHKLFLLTCLGTPNMIDAENRAKWDKEAKALYSDYVHLLLGLEEADHEKEAEDEKTTLMDYYENVVKPSAPVLSRDGQGNLHVKGLPESL
jgi:hypothetical protein